MRSDGGADSVLVILGFLYISLELLKLKERGSFFCGVNDVRFPSLIHKLPHTI